MNFKLIQLVSNNLEFPRLNSNSKNSKRRNRGVASHNNQEDATTESPLPSEIFLDDASRRVDRATLASRSRESDFHLNSHMMVVDRYTPVYVNGLDTLEDMQRKADEEAYRYHTRLEATKN